MKIFKYPLEENTGEQTVRMPRSATPISFGLDPRDGLCVWATIEDETPLADHRFFLAFTGTEFPSEVARVPSWTAPSLDAEGILRTPIHRFMGTAHLTGDLAFIIIHCFYLDHT